MEKLLASANEKLKRINEKYFDLLGGFGFSDNFPVHLDSDNKPYVFA